MVPLISNKEHQDSTRLSNSQTLLVPVSLSQSLSSKSKDVATLLLGTLKSITLNHGTPPTYIQSLGSPQQDGTIHQ